MKKALTKVLLTAITLVIFAAIIPLSASASTEDNKNDIFRTLTTKLDFNPAVACGIMANMEKESGFDPTVVITDSNGLLSGGLCQWNGGRFTNLRNFCNNNGYSYLSIEGQLAYLKHEISSSYYYHIYEYLKSCPNTADGAYNAAWYWCYYFEVPANRATKANERGSVAKSKYWPDFGVEDLKAPKLSFQNKKSPYDIGNTVSLKWSDGGDDVSNYYLYVTAKNSKGKYDWSKATITKLGSGVTSGSIKSSAVIKSGDYSACVRAYSARSGKYINSNFATFTVKCLSHERIYTVKEPATFENEGVQLITCKQCDASATKKIPKLTANDFKALKVKNFKVAAYNDKKIKLQWSKLDGADGYQLYYRSGESWKLFRTVKNGSTTSYVVSGLEQGKKYEFNMRAYRTAADNKAIYSKASGGIYGATRPEAPILTNLTQGAKNATLNWSTVEGVDGYAVYVAEGQDSTKYKLLKQISDPEATSYTATDFKKGQYYYFTVKSFIKTTDGYAISPSSEIFYIIGK